MMSPPNESNWIEPPSAVALEHGMVHVWRATDDISASRLEQIALTLDPEERRRAAAFRFEPDRRRFTLCRGILRELLGRYLGQPPESIRFAGGRRGKPALDDASRRRRPVEFNLSHTKGMALFAFTVGQPIGVDVEAVDLGRSWEPLAERFLHPNEWQRISNEPASHRAAAFYDCWTWKEAYVKALGEGLSRGLSTFDVIPAPDTAGRAILHAPDDPNDARWWLKSLQLGPTFAAAVASPLVPIKLDCFRWVAD